MAADDVDGLLDELDGMLKEEPERRSHSSSNGMAKSANPWPPAATTGADDIDSLLADLDAPTAAAAPHARAPAVSRPPPPRANSSSSSVASASISFPSGGDSSDTSTNLRCTNCDFRVLRFIDNEWSKDVDYMFFRNFMPNEAKLRPKLKVGDGRCAYACQCSWASIDLGDRVPNSKWVPTR